MESGVHHQFSAPMFARVFILFYFLIIFVMSRENVGMLGSSTRPDRMSVTQASDAMHVTHVTQFTRSSRHWVVSCVSARSPSVCAAGRPVSVTIRQLMWMPDILHIHNITTVSHHPQIICPLLLPTHFPLSIFLSPSPSHRPRKSFQRLRGTSFMAISRRHAHRLQSFYLFFSRPNSRGRQ